MPAPRFPQRTLAAVCLGSAIITLHPGGRAQAPPAAQSPDTQRPVLRATTRLVEVNVVVHDRKGASVANLTRDEFQVYDSGVKQDVAMLRVERVTAASAAPAEERTPPVPPLPPGTFSNLVDGQAGGTDAVTVILMDDLNTPLLDQAFAHRHLIKFLGTLKPTDRIALYALGHDLRILHDFTDDREALLRVLRRHRIYAGPEVALGKVAAYNTENANLDAFLTGTDRFVADAQAADRARITLDAMTAIAAHVAGVPGRKNLVWVSGGFPFAVGEDQWPDDIRRDTRTFAGPMERAARAVADARLAIYPVDAHSLFTASDLTAVEPIGVNSVRPLPPTGPSETVRQAQLMHVAMDVLAKRTGGRAFFSTADLTGAIRSAIDDANVTYVLGYYPTHQAWNGTFRTLTVKVTRPGLNVRHRVGYVAFADEPATGEARTAALAQAARSPVDATLIGLTLQLARDEPAAGMLRATIVIDARHLSVQPRGTRVEAQVDMRFVMQGTAEGPPMSATRTVSFDLARDAYEEAMKTGLRVTQDVDVAQCGYRLKVVVRDAVSGRIGSVTARPDALRPAATTGRRPTSAP